MYMRTIPRKSTVTGTGLSSLTKKLGDKFVGR